MLNKIEADKGMMLQDIDLDWCTYYCPCGESRCTRRETDDQIRAWKALHRPHTNGRVKSHTTADGRRAWGGQDVPDEIRYLKGGDV